MPDLLVRLTKHAPADYALTCARSDGSATSQRTHGDTSVAFIFKNPFPPPDVHSVESKFGHAQAPREAAAQWPNLMPWASGRASE